MIEEEHLHVNKMAVRLARILKAEDPTIEGFTLGTNCGEVAGQTVFHAHMHVIPRRAGDVDNPEGGVRNIITNQDSKYP
jgi:diadenosine tetraphosphate (Ap4A) HIT family hydrolase